MYFQIGYVGESWKSLLFNFGDLLCVYTQTLNISLNAQFVFGHIADAPAYFAVSDRRRLLTLTSLTKKSILQTILSFIKVTTQKV